MSDSVDIGKIIGPEQWAAYERFVATHKSKFRRISYATLGEHAPGDVETEAIVVAQDLHIKHGRVVDFDSSSFRHELFQHLYQKLVVYTERNVRFAIRLDHGVEEDEPHPLAGTLVGDDGRDPLALLLEKENALGCDKNADGHPSQAAAYVRLLEHFNYRMMAVSNHLLLSISYTYKRVADATVLAKFQQPMALPLPGPNFVPGPWRRFKLMRLPVQLTLDLEDQTVLG